MKKTENLKQLGDKVAPLLVDALKDLHYKKRSAYKKNGMPETMEELQQCKVALEELKEIEELQQELTMGALFIEINENPNINLNKETSEKGENNNEKES
jgi:hypothetical protein